MRRTRTALVVFVVLAAAGLGAWLLARDAGDPAARPTGEPTDGATAPPAAATLSPAGADTGSAAAAMDAPATTPAPGSTPSAGAAVAKGTGSESKAGTAPPAAGRDFPLVDPADEGKDLPAAVVRSPFGLPPPPPGSRSVGGGGTGPTGHWTKFAPTPPPGDAVLEATVVDATGAPVVDAKVYLLPPEHLGIEGVSFGDARDLGATGADGTLRAAALPRGRAAVAADVDGRFRGPRGLDARSAVPVVLRPGMRSRAEVRLPVSLADLGDVRGLVVDGSGAPVPRAQASAGLFGARATTDGTGTFLLRRLSAGPQRVSVAATGRSPVEVTVDVVGGSVADVKVRLDWADTGSLSLAGTVKESGGGPVARATVYLIEGGRATLRTVVTDPQGAFAFADLPDRLRTADVRVQANAAGYAPGNARFEKGLDGWPIVVTLPPRRARLVVSVVSGTTGQPVRGCRVQAFPYPGDGSGADPELAWIADTMTYSGPRPEGPHRIRVEALDAEPAHVDVSVPAGESVLEVKVTLALPAEPTTTVRTTLRIASAATGESIPAARIEVFEKAGGGAVARYEGRGDAGSFVMPVPSGTRPVRVTADGFEPLDDVLVLERGVAEAERTLRLTPR